MGAGLGIVLLGGVIPKHFREPGKVPDAWGGSLL